MIRFHDTPNPHVDCDHEGFAWLKRTLARSEVDPAGVRAALAPLIPFGVPVYVNDCPDSLHDMCANLLRFWPITSGPDTKEGT